MSADECPAGGEHTWVELSAWEAGPGSDPGGWRCDECGARPPELEERRERDRRTVEAVARLYRKHDAELIAALFDGIPTDFTLRLDPMARYLEVMARPPLHADEDRVTLKQSSRRRCR